MRKSLPIALAAMAAGGAIAWWKQRAAPAEVEATATSTAEPASASATSLSAQPHKRTRLTQPTPTIRRDAPPPDSAEEGRTPYYFVPGEAVIMLHGAEAATPELLREAASHFGGEVGTMGAVECSYPAPEREGWLTVFRLRWTDAPGYEETMIRFVTLEEQVNEGISWGSIRVASWMPNWLGTIASADGLYVPGGPAAYPRPVPAPPDGLPLKDVPFLNEWRENASQPVTLVVADTFPVHDEEAASVPEALKLLTAKLPEELTALSLDEGAYYATFRTGETFEMSDHGLMTTWLATEVIGTDAMQHVTLEPLRVASALGVCSAADIIAKLAPLVSRAQGGESMVVLLAFNLGMGDIIPPRLRPYEEHYEPLRLVCLALSEAGATLIGASGNDGSGLQHPPRTRLPASFRSVIEVTSGQLTQPGLALYANQAKALSLFGGEATRLNEMADHVPALIGPAISRELKAAPGSVVPNSAGWAAWAGTSFAAALAAGLTVLLRAREPDLRMWEVRTRLRALATETRNPGNVPYIDLIRPPSD